VILRSLAVFFSVTISFFGSVALAVDPITLCENLILDADKNQLVMQLNPVVTRSALHREISRLVDFTEGQLKAIPDEIKDAWSNRVYANDYFGVSFLRSIAHTTGMSTPTEISDLNAKKALLEKRRARLLALSVLLSQVAQISVALAPARHIPDIHPDGAFEIEINEWIEVRAVESTYALVQLAMVNPDALSEDRKQKGEALYNQFVSELAGYVAHLETSVDSDSRNPLVATYLDDVSVAKVAEIRQWAEKEFGGPVEKDFLIQLVSALVSRPGVMSEHLETLSEVRKQSVEMFGSPEGRKGFLVIARGVLLKVIDPGSVGESLRAVSKAVATSRGVLQSLTPESTGHFVYLQGMTGKSIAELVREFNVASSTLLYQENRTLDVRTNPHSQQVLLLMLYANAKRLGGTAYSPVSEFPSARRALERLPHAWSLAPEDVYLASAVLISIAHFAQLESMHLIAYIQDIYSIVDEEPIADCNWRFFEWIRVANFGLEQKIPAKAMVQFLRTARTLRGYVPPAERFISVLSTVQDNSSASTETELDIFSPQALADGFAVPFTYDLDVLYSLIPDSTAVDFPMVAGGGWNFIQDVRPDATFANYLQGGLSIFLTAGEDGNIAWQLPASIYEGDARVGLPVRTGP